MDMKKYDQDPLEALTDEQLAEIASYTVPFCVDSQPKIAAQFEQKREETASKPPEMHREDKAKTRRRPRVALIAACIGMLTLAVGFASKDNLSELLFRYFGTNSQHLVQDITVHEISVTDQDVELQIMYSVRDEERSYLFFRLSDPREKRLTMDTYMQDSFEIAGGAGVIETVVVAEDGSWGDFVLEYDINEEALRDKNVDFHLFGIFAERELVKETLFYTPEELFGEEKVFTIATGTGELSGSITAAFSEYAEEFYVAVKMQPAALLSAADLQLIEAVSGETVTPSFYVQDTRAGYVEFYFPNEMLETFRSGEISISLVNYQQQIIGRWQVSVPAPELTTAEEIACDLVIDWPEGRFTIARMLVSPLTATLVIEDPDEVFYTYAAETFSSLDPDRFSLIHDNGEVVRLRSLSMAEDEGLVEIDLGGMGVYVPTAVTGIQVGERIISLIP